MTRRPLLSIVPNAVSPRRMPRLTLDPETLSQAAVLVFAVLAGALAADVAAHGRAVAVALVIGLGTYVFVLALVPVGTLPVVALLTTLLVPMSSSLLPASVQNTPIGVIPLAVWLARSQPRSRQQLVPCLLAMAFLVWLLLAELAAPLHTRRGLEWLVTAGVCLSAACIRPPLMRDPTIVRTWFLRITTAAACYAVVEGFLLHRNVAFAFLFRGTTWWVPQHASISYRVTTIFGHPLVNGLIFAVGGTFAAADFLRRRERPSIAILRVVLLVAAVLATHSRGPAIGLGVGIILVLIFIPSDSYARGTRRTVLAAGAVLATVVIVSGLQARDQSIAGQQSVAFRSTVVTEALQAARTVEPFGAGPGESEAYRVNRSLPGTGPGRAYRPLENSYAELLVSIGIVGLGLFWALLLVPAFSALTGRGNRDAAVALVVLLVVLADFNAVEGFPTVLVLISLLLITIMQPSALPSTAPDSLRP